MSFSSCEHVIRFHSIFIRSVKVRSFSRKLLFPLYRSLSFNLISCLVTCERERKRFRHGFVSSDFRTKCAKREPVARERETEKRNKFPLFGRTKYVQLMREAIYESWRLVIVIAHRLSLKRVINISVYA